MIPAPPEALLGGLWRSYVEVTPQVERVRALFTSRGERLINDHVALRTFGREPVGLDALARPFVEAGWAPRDDYRFPDKHLRARYYQHPSPDLPKVFISELEMEAMSAATAARIDALLAALPPGFAEEASLPYAGRPWPIDHATYRALLAESEYAAWVAAFGFRANHFTVDVGRLTTLPDLAAVNAMLVEHGVALNTSGGAIKGGPHERLEQSSTLADAVDVAFADGTFRIPSCYYEFAKRYPLPDGTLFQGFVPASADKIFESTDVRR